MAKQWFISILGRNEIDCHGLRHILSDGDFTIDHCLPDSAAITFQGWRNDPDHIIIVDNMSAPDAIERCTMLREALDLVRIVLMSDDCDIGTIRDAFATGVDGILARQIAAKPLTIAIRLVALGQKVMPSQFVKMLTAGGGIPSHTEWAAHSTLAHLSSREIGILACLVAGDANKTIARKLSVAEATVKAHIKAILRKLQLDNRTQAAIWAINHGAQDGALLDRGIDPGRAGIADHHGVAKEHLWRP